MYNTQTGQLTFWGGNPQGGITLQSINAPTLTYQQYLELANGKMPQGVRPYTWYYYPILHEWIYVTPPQYTLNVGNIQITNPEVIGFVQQYGNNNVLITNLGMIGNPDELAFIYLTPNGNGKMLIYNTITGQVVNIVSIKNLKTGNSNYDYIVQSIFYQQYYPSNNQLITFQIATNNLNSYVNNEPIADILGSSPVYVTVDLVNNTIYLQNVLGQVIGTKTFKNKSSMLSYLQSTYGISPLSVIAAENPQIAQIVNSNAPITTPNINTIYQYSNLIPGTTTINMPGSTINNVPIIIPTQQPQYITGVMTLPVKLSKQQIEKMNYKI